MKNLKNIVKDTLRRSMAESVDKSVKSVVLLFEFENGDVHQCFLTKVQETAVKSVLKALPDNVQVSAEKLDLEIKHPLESKTKK